MNRKVLIAVAVIVLLVVGCGAVACTPLGNAVGVTHSDCDAGDRLEGDSDCRSGTKKPKKATKKPTKKPAKKPAKTTRR